MNRKSFLKFTLLVFPVLYLCVIILFYMDVELYVEMALEDRAIEWATAGFLLMASIMAIVMAATIKNRKGYYHWFFIAAAVVFLFGGLEEISYGQRILGMKTPEFFSKSDQREINLHNLLQGVAKRKYGLDHSHYFKAKAIAQHVAIIYGVFLPVFMVAGLGKKYVEKIKLVTPPIELVPAFVLAAVLLSDMPTGEEEEYGELFLSLCFFLQMWSEHLREY